MRKGQQALNRTRYGHLMFCCMQHSTEPFFQNEDGLWVRGSTIYNWRVMEQATMSNASLQQLPSTRFGWTSVLVALCLESNGKRKVKMEINNIRGGWTSDELDDKVNILAWTWAQKFTGVINWGHLSFPVFPKLCEHDEEALLRRLEKLVDVDKFWNHNEFRFRP